MKGLPGPGQYSPKDRLTKDGVYKVSGMRNTATLKFLPSDRFKNTKNYMPGPGQYNLPSSIHPDGKYYISGYKSSTIGLFGSGARKNDMLKMSNTPGPGNYDAPTELGFMEKNLIK